jgi:hypothetical protein
MQSSIHRFIASIVRIPSEGYRNIHDEEIPISCLPKKILNYCLYFISAITTNSFINKNKLRLQLICEIGIKDVGVAG